MSGPSAPKRAQASRYASTSDEASMRGIIVLESARSKIKPRRQPSNEPVADLSAQTAESHDPETLRKIVRRQAALASADKRRATIAASRLKQSQRSKNNQRSAPRLENEANTETALVPQFKPPAFVFDPGRHEIDPFSIFPVDFSAVKDANLLHSLFEYIVEVASPMMDLRLPTVYDSIAVDEMKWAREMPAQALRSAPAFWSVMAGAATAVALDRGKHPGSDSLTLKFRQMSIQAVNSQIANLGNSEPDLGILGAISVLGTWERTWGSEEAWQAHRRGMKALAVYLSQGGPQNALYAQVLLFAEQDCAPVPVMQSPQSDESAIMELGIGFRELQDNFYLDNNLVNALLSCDTADAIEPGAEKEQAIREVATDVGRFASNVAFTSIAHRDPKRNREGDRKLLQLHVLLQSAGISMIRTLEPKLPSVAIIDVQAMCKAAIVSGKSVATEAMYNEILFWAMVTIWAMNREAEEEGLETIRSLAQRLQMDSSPFETWEYALQRFVFLESARQKYERLWYSVMMLQDQQALLNPEDQDVEYNCQTQ